MRGGKVYFFCFDRKSRRGKANGWRIRRRGGGGGGSTGEWEPEAVAVAVEAAEAAGGGGRSFRVKKTLFWFVTLSFTFYALRLKAEKFENNRVEERER